MTQSQRLDRKSFLKLTISIAGASATGGWLIGCSSGEDPEGGSGSGGTNSAGSGAGGKAGSGTGGTGGSSSGTSGAGGGSSGTTSTGGGAGKGAGGSAGTASGGAGTGPGGSGGTTAGAGGSMGGTAGTGGGAGGTGGSALGGAGSGGKGTGGSAGGSGGSAGSGGSKCTALTMSQETMCAMQCAPHDHIPMDANARDTFFEELLAHITGPDALEPFRVPTEGPPGGEHPHDIQFTQQELDTLLAGGTIMNKQKVADEIEDYHEWTITVTCG